MTHESLIIKSIIEKFGNIESVSEIWEIGSRDGEDSLMMARTFPLAKIKAFEPNPDTFQKVKDVSNQSFGQIQCYEIALSDVDDMIVFNKIDTTKTITTWPDGNPGASSIFISNDKYDIERYVQVPIRVKSQKAKTLIEDEGFKTPNLIWMDVQGAEELVIKGFAEYLSDVDFIYMELSLKPMYIGQSLADEVIRSLSDNFIWHSNLTYGAWQFDGFFVNRKYRSRKLICQHLLLRLSLNSGLNIGIKYSFRTFLLKLIYRIFGNPYSKVKSFLFNRLRKSESKLSAFIITNLILNSAQIINLRKLSSTLRQIISLVQLTDPLRGEDLPTIDVAIPCHMKDFENLPFVIEGARANVRNPIGRIILITPSDFVGVLQSNFPECLVTTDERVLGADLIQAIDEFVIEEKKGWILQQIIKFRIALLNNSRATLILDADTILLRPKIFLDAQGKQILCFAEEYYVKYKGHQESLSRGKPMLMSFVTHYQLMQSDFVREIFGSHGEGLIEWLKFADYSDSYPLSEYDTYGEWILRNKPNKVAFAKWNNAPIKIEPENTSYEVIKRRYSKYDSISNHSHLI